ncbi:MAG: hypothetical protein JJ896_05170 [Rhodothermales bacterium]|nr:hypothetical protein [Rhodothermales bacterium]MBO6779024.1 hypothetical protein [Rhodothermales bacterium]
MAHSVSWSLRGNVSDLDAWRELMHEMVASTKNEAGARTYEWYISEDGATCHILESYADSEAVMEHLGNFGANFAERFMGLFQPTEFVIYGPASDQVKEALAGFQPSYLGTLGGFRR